MPTTSLPIDILHLLLLEISDLDSLYSLILTYKCFYFVFIHTKSAILSVVLENEILQHRHDAYFLARYHDDLLYSAIPSEANFYEIIGKYVSLRGGNENTPDLVLPSVDDHGLRDKARIHHGCIRSTC